MKQLIIRTIERYCLLTDTPHCKDNWETPFITKTIEIYPPTRDATSNQHLADKEDEEGSNLVSCPTKILHSNVLGAIPLYNDTQS